MARRRRTGRRRRPSRASCRCARSALGEILDGAVQTIRQNPKVMLGLSAVVNLALTVIVVLVQIGNLGTAFGGLNSFGSSSDQTTADAGQLVASLVAALLQFVGTTLLTGLLVIAVSDAVLGRRPGIGEVWSRARGRIWALLGVTAARAAGGVRRRAWPACCPGSWWPSPEAGRWPSCCSSSAAWPPSCCASGSRSGCCSPRRPCCSSARVSFASMGAVLAAGRWLVVAVLRHLAAGPAARLGPERRPAGAVAHRRPAVIDGKRLERRSSSRSASWPA